MLLCRDFLFDNLSYIYNTMSQISILNFFIYMHNNVNMFTFSNNSYFFILFYDIWFFNTESAIFLNNCLDTFFKTDFFFNFNNLNFLNASIFYIHPELQFINLSITNFFFNNFFSNFYLTIINQTVQLATSLVLLKLIFFIWCFFFCVLLLVFFDITFKFSNTTFLQIFLITESEKEIAAFDDLIAPIFFFFFLFGFYFFSNSLFLFLNKPALIFIFYFLPFFFCFFFGLPINLLIDFGLCFLIFLRGGAASSAYILELIFDYIGVLAFFVRLVVQLVRLIVMFFVYSVMHDAVIIEMSDFSVDFIKTSFWEDTTNLFNNNFSASYYFFISLPQRILYWIYEVIHTFFVVTVQFAAFFVIAFWLFLLFYTFFIFEKFENHFKNIRASKLLNNKNSFKNFALNGCLHFFI